MLFRISILFFFSFIYLVAQDVDFDAMFDASADKKEQLLDTQNIDAKQGKEAIKDKELPQSGLAYIVGGVVKTLAEATSHIEKEASLCYSLRDEERRMMCLALKLNKKSYCYGLHNKSNKDMCLGFCYENSLTKGQSAFCLAVKQRNQAFCYDMNIKGNLQKTCLGWFNKSQCYGIHNDEDRNFCLGISQN
jgi:hypothetical protein